MGKRSVSAWQSVKTFIKFKTAITFNQVASSHSIQSTKSFIAMFDNIFLIFIFDLVWKLMQNPNIYMHVIERPENTPGRVDTGRVDPGPTWLKDRFDFRPSWPATLKHRQNKGLKDKQ